MRKRKPSPHDEALVAALMRADVDAVKAELTAGGLPSCDDLRGFIEEWRIGALGDAAAKTCFELVLASDYDLESQNRFGLTLFLAAIKHDPALQLVLARSPNLNHQTKDGLTALHFVEGDVARFDRLVAAGVDASLANKKGRAPKRE